MSIHDDNSLITSENKSYTCFGQNKLQIQIHKKRIKILKLSYTEYKIRTSNMIKEKKKRIEELPQMTKKV